MNMQKKEQVLYFLLNGNINLSQYDYKFLGNLQTMITRDKRITSNQSDLFDKLLSKYAKQLKKQGISSENIKLLSWDTMKVESTLEYTGAIVSIVNDDITIRVPFNKSFITAFRDIPNNPFNWNKELKLYVSAFGTVALKIATTKLNKFFHTVQYCDNIKKLLADIQTHDAMVWNPTLTMVNDKLLIAACTEVLWEKIADIKLSLDPKVLSTLSRFGIVTDPKLVENDPVLKFASQRIIHVDITEVQQIVDMIKKLDYPICFSGPGGGYSNLAKEFMQIMHNNKIKTSVYNSNINQIIITTRESDTIKSSTNYPKMAKMIVVKDSRPVEIK